MDEEINKKTAEALKAGANAAKRLGGIACALGKKGYETAREKAKELGEKAREARASAAAKREEEARIYAEQVKEAEQLAARRLQEDPEHVAASGQTAKSISRWQGDPEDKDFPFIHSALCLAWWIGNILYSILCLKWFASALESRWTRDTAWVALVVWALALLLNRLAYEGAVAFFEMVRHLRQIRDELRRHNMREETGDHATLENTTANQSSGMSETAVATPSAAAMGNEISKTKGK